MKVVRFTNAILLSALLGITASAYAQHGHDGDRSDHSKRQDEQRHEGKHDEGRAESRHVPPQAKHEERHAPAAHIVARPPERIEARHEHPGHPNTPAPHGRAVGWEKHRAQNWEHEHRDWRDRGGYHGYRIPDHKYRAYFGPEHAFRVHGRPFRVVGGHPRFQYNGFWFTFVEPWPEMWAPNWYERDTVYVAYVNDGYYLVNRSHPGVRVAVNISF